MTGTSDRRLTTADLENLTQEIKSLPWSVGYDEGDETWVIHATHPTLPLPLDVGTAYTEAAARVMVVAPTLAADLHHVRKALEALRDEYAAPPKHDLSGDKFAQGMESSYQVVAHALTRILEGGTRE